MKGAICSVIPVAEHRTHEFMVGHRLIDEASSGAVDGDDARLGPIRYRMREYAQAPSFRLNSDAGTQ